MTRPGWVRCAVVGVLAGSLTACGSGGQTTVRWTPEIGTTWDLGYLDEQPALDGAAVLSLDGADTSAGTVAAAHRYGTKVLCYVNVGAWEDWRDDAGEFPEAVIGEPLTGWEGEYWLDVRHRDVLEPLMERRLDECVVKGFDAIEPDNVDGYANATGFELTKADSLAWIETIADLAHDRGLAIALKNSPELVGEMVESVDFAVVEECVRFVECDAYLPFIDASRAVLHIEYDGDLAAICGARPAAFSTILRAGGDGARQAC